MLAGSIGALGGCASSEDGRHHGRPRTINLWIAPNEADEAFWKVAIARWNSSGRGLPVNFTTIPTAGSSEDTILMALVAGTAPDISTNIFSGFAVQLADLKAIEPLSRMPGYSRLIHQRKMSGLMENWHVDGEVYAIPIYSNPALIWWRSDILDRYGFVGAPTTYDDVYALSERYSRSESRYGFKVTAGNGWEDRWFDFIAYYYAASQGRPYIANDKAIFDNQAGLEVAEFINRMFREGWSAKDFGSEDPLVSGLVAGAVHGSWDLGAYRRMYPATMKNIVVGPMIAKTVTEEKTATFSDSKGFVLFSHSRVKNEAFSFIEWVIGDEDLNLLWLEKTGMMPARTDLLSNPVFNEHFERNPLDKVYATYVPVAKPPAPEENTIDIQKAMSLDLVDPLVFQTGKPKAALGNTAARVDQILRSQQ